VARDSSGNFSAGTITATLSGSSTSATTATNLAGGAANRIPYQTAAGTTAFTTAASGTNYVLNYNGSAFTWVSGTISGVALGSNLNSLTAGTYLTGTAYNGSAAQTWTVDATSANTASKVVARDASGNFSAGTITATLSGTATNVSGTVATANGGTGLTSFTSGGVVYASSTSALATGSALYFNGTSLGVGTNAPNFKVQVVASGSATTGGQINIQNNATRAIGNSGRLSFSPNNDYTGTVIGAYIEGLDISGTSTNNCVLGFGTGSGGVTTEKMRLDQSGNLGIGTTSPSSKLESIGTITSNKNATQQYLALSLKNSTQNYSFYVDQDNIGSNSFSLFDTTNSHNVLRYLPSSSGYWQFYTNNTERFRIGSAGQLGIGGANYGTAGQVLTSAGSGAAPSWQTSTAAAKGFAVGMSLVFGR
jgi:hypothetical protein